MKLLFSNILFLLFVCNTINSKEVNLSTPQKSVYNHFNYLQKDFYHPEKSIQSFFTHNQTLAIKLKKYLDSKGYLIKYKLISNNKDYYDSNEGDSIYYLVEEEEEIYLRKYNGKWLYSEETCLKINSLYNSILPFGLEEITDNLPEVMFSKFLGMELWQWSGLLLLIVLSLLIYTLTNYFVGQYVLKKLSNIDITNGNVNFFTKVLKPLIALIVIVFLNQTLPYLQLDVRISNFVKIIFGIIYPILISISAYRFVDYLSIIFANLALKTESKIDDQLVPLVRKTLKIIVIIFGTFYLIDNLGINYTPFLAGASIGGLAIALAAQETMKNFFGSITLLADKPFNIGDWVVFDGNEGHIEEVGVRSTRVRTFYNSELSIPNGKMADAIIDNMGRRKLRRYKTYIGITYNTDPDKIEKYVAGLIHIVLDMEFTNKEHYEIHLNDFATSSFSILVYIFFEVPDWTSELNQRQEFILKSIKLAKTLGIEFAYPTQTIYFGDPKLNLDIINKI